MNKLLLKTLLIATLPLSMYAAKAITTVSVSNNQINIDISKSIGNCTTYVWKNGKYFTRIIGSGLIPLQSAAYKFLTVARDSKGRSYKFINRKFSSSGAIDNRINKKPIAKLDITINNLQATIDLSKSTDSDGSIQSYKAYLYKNNKFYKVLSKTQTIDLEPNKYRVIAIIMDNDGAKSYKSQYFTINKPAPIVNPNISEEPNTIASNANYTLGTPSVKVTNPKTKEFLLSPHLDRIHADAAYEQGWTGKGVKVAVIDSGIDYNHQDLKSNILSYESIVSNSDGMDDYGHGTHVAGIIAAEKNDIGMHGIAYDASIISIKVLDNKGRGTISNIAKGIDRAVQLDVKVANLSLGGLYWNTTYFKKYANSYRNALKADTSIIVAAGNNAGQCKDMGYSKTGRCNYPAALPAFDEYKDFTSNKYDGAFIAVGSVRNDNKLAYYSNAAGITKDWYMVAPGGDIFDNGIYGSTVISTKSSIEKSSIMDEKSTTTTHKQGTSMAAPMVTGAFALLAQKFPYLKGREVRDILFVSATDLGEAGVDEIYGHGLLNIEKAMKPIGELNIPTGGIVDNGPKFSAKKTKITTSSAFGNALSIPMSNIMVFDDFNRGYTMDLSSSVSITEPTFNIDSFNKMKIGKSLILGLNEESQTFVIGTELDSFKVLFSHADNLFGADGSGAMGINNGSTNYISLETPNLNGLSFEMSYGIGTANVSGIFNSISTVTAYSTSMNYKSEDSLSVSLSMPMRINSGYINASIPTQRILDEVKTNNETISLEPNGREIDLAITKINKLTQNSSITYSANYSKDSMNIKGINEGNVLAYYNVCF